MKTALACIACLILASDATACRNGPGRISTSAHDSRIVGTVEDDQIDPKRLSYANVVIVGTTMGKMTRDGGRFAIEAVPEGTYRLKASFPYCESQIVDNVAVEANRTTVIRFCLKRSNTRTPTIVNLRDSTSKLVRPQMMSQPKVVRTEVSHVPTLGSVASHPPVEISIGGRRLMSRSPSGHSRKGSPQIRALEAARLALEREIEPVACACGTARVLVDGGEATKSTAAVGAVELADLPKVTRLRGNTPNPFNPATTIFFDLAEKTRVEMRIYDVRGRLVRQLLSAEHEPGSHAIVWDGKTTTGQSVSSSVYFLHMRAGSVNATRRLIVVR